MLLPMGLLLRKPAASFINWTMNVRSFSVTDLDQKQNKVCLFYDTDNFYGHLFLDLFTETIGGPAAVCAVIFF